jgi:heme-degrading monooxygenase HmoA
MRDERPAPDSTAVRVALWRALHALIDPPPHVFEDAIGLRLIAPDEDWRHRPDMDPAFTRPFRASIVARARYIEDALLEQVQRGIDQYIIRRHRREQHLCTPPPAVEAWYEMTGCCWSVVTSRFQAARSSASAERCAYYFGASVLRRSVGQEVEFMTMTRFASLDAIRKFARADYEAAHVAPRARELLSRFDARCQHFELVVEDTPGN